MIAGIIVDSTRDAIRRGKLARDMNVAALQVTPVHYLFKPDDQAMVDHFRRMAAGKGIVAGGPAAVDLQIMANGPTQFCQLLQQGADTVPADLMAANITARHGARISVEGHCDDVGADASNLELSRKRACTVADWLTAHGVSPALVTVRGYGKSKPKYPSDSDVNRARNRRVEIIMSQ